MICALVVMAKAPVPGRSKTRLCPPCSFEEAAALAEAALGDTLEAVVATRVARSVVVLDGEPGPWLPRGLEVIPQRGGGLDERLAAAFEDTDGPALLIGMDTPQITPGVLERSLAKLAHPAADALLGDAEDGGYWAIGLRRPDPVVFLDVPMSTSRTAAAQRHRLGALGLRVGELPRLHDVDRIEDAYAVASTIPGSRFAGMLATVRPRPVAG
ncbi:MAG: TIGR04282 family arsenosugar biosynthesis glycosyltransferase [Actinomycetota bacterium]